MTEPGRRHRWISLDIHLPEKHWRCCKCGMLKEAEYESPNQYELGTRRWVRFAPPCPPENAVALDKPAVQVLFREFGRFSNVWSAEAWVAFHKALNKAERQTQA